MDARNINDLKHFVNELSKKFAQSEKFLTLKLATRLTKAASSYPQDQTVIQMANFLNRKAESGIHLISRAELFDVYNRLYTTNTKAASLLSEELGQVEDRLPQAHKVTRDINEGECIDDLYSRYADSKLVNELEAAFDKNATYKPYSQKAAVAAEGVIRGILGDKVAIKVVDGSDFAILCQATYETPKGQSHVLIPVEVVEDKALIPNMFLSASGFVNLDESSLNQHVLVSAGKNFKADAGKILEAIKIAKFGQREELDSIDMAVMSLKAKGGTPSEWSADGIIYQEVDGLTPDVNVESEEVKTFADQLNSVAGTAEFIFGKTAVATGKNIINSELQEIGYRGAVIKVASIKEDTITYAVSVNGSGFKVPVKVSEGKVKYPSIVIASGSVEDFSSEGLKNAINDGDQEASAIANGYDLASSTDLIKEVERACEVGDLNRASDAISAIQLSGDETALTYAFATYMSAIDGTLVKKASVKSGHKIKTIKIGGNEVCAQTFLPVDKVYVDENGVAHAKHRQHVEHTDAVSGAGFMNAKVIMGL